MRTLSSRKLGEVEALLERTQAMKGWLEGGDCRREPAWGPSPCGYSAFAYSPPPVKSTPT